MNSLRQAGSAWRRWIALLWLGCLPAILLPSAGAYVLDGQHWPSDQAIVMHLDLGSPSNTLIDGSTSWDQVAEAAMNVWNPYLASGVQFQVGDPAVTPAQHDGYNSVFFSNTVYGDDFGSDTLAVTTTYYNTSTNTNTQSDVVVNSVKPFDSYRGDLRYGNGGKTLNDLRRVLIHEFGHVLGLNHTPQGAASIMAPAITDLDTVQSDDINGVQSIYGVPRVLPVITSSLSITSNNYNTISYQITATGLPNSFQASGLPDGLGLNNATGAITGYPKTAGTYSVTLSATNGFGTGTATLTLTVVFTPVITSATSVAAVVGQPFTYQITADNHPTKFAAYAGFDEVRVDAATGLLTGTPTTPGTYTISLAATNSAGTGRGSVVVTVLFDTAVTTIHSFVSDREGSAPTTALVQAGDGNFYGSTSMGEYNNWGSLFKVTPDGTLTTLYILGFDLGTVVAPLILGNDGNLYGTTGNGGTGGAGTVFQLTTGGTLTVLHNFTVFEGAYPGAALLQARDGNFYGTTNYGGIYGQAGMAFRMTPDGTLTVLHQFLTGENECSALIQGADGNLYGTNVGGGANSQGAIFKMTPDGTLTVLHSFDNITGNDPAGALVLGKDGNFYGATKYTGDKGPGSLFKMAPDGTLTTLHTFGTTEGTEPTGLVLGKDGNFYGTTRSGGNVAGNPAYGTFFRMTPDGVLTTLHYFASSEGYYPTALTLGLDGEFYGATYEGGPYSGTIFKTALNKPAVVLPVVTLEATAPTATVGSGQNGVFTVTLSAPQPIDTLIHYTVKGSAANGADYVLLRGTKKIKAGKSSKPIKIVPQGDLGGASKKVVKLTLSPDAAYTVGTPSASKVKILAAP